jgi:hypothetical protein
MKAGNFGILQMATDRFKAHCSVRGLIFQGLSGVEYHLIVRCRRVVMVVVVVEYW